MLKYNGAVLWAGFFLSLFCSLFLSCTLKTDIPKDNKQPVPDQITVQPTKSKESVEQKKMKELASVLRFSASVEREIFKIIRNNLSPSMTQFEIISAVIDQNIGVKKKFGLVDCKLYRIDRNLDRIQIFKQCLTPEALIASIDLKKQQATVHFNTKEWAYTVGTSVALTAKNRICDIYFTDSKLKRLSCENTQLLVDQSADIVELKLSEFVFDQEAKNQVQVSGGFFKNLTEHRKLKLSIPFDGKIKIIEKELKVQDDFAVPVDPPKPAVQIMPTDNQRKKTLENGDRNGNESKEKSEKNINQEQGHQQIDPVQNQEENQQQEISPEENQERIYNEEGGPENSAEPIKESEPIENVGR
jgi:hypothetical protein